MNSAHLIHRYFNPDLGDLDRPEFLFVAAIGPVVVALGMGLLLAVCDHLALFGAV